MNVEISPDVFGHQIVFPWEGIASAVRAGLARTLGAQPDDCQFEPLASDAGKVRCFYATGLGTMAVPFYVEIDLGTLAESFADALSKQPAFDSLRLVSGTISTNEHGDIILTPSPLADKTATEPTHSEPEFPYRWTNGRWESRKAARAYSEQTHADY